MRHIDKDSFPHMVELVRRIVIVRWHTLWGYIAAWWWGVSLGENCVFNGISRFSRHPRSHITIDKACHFNSSSTSNLIGINRPCIISTLTEGAEIQIGSNCGFSGTIIGCASKIIISENVRCGANTLITDTDWHTDDPRAGNDAPVTIESGVWLGVNVTVLKGVTIGENTLVAAGSLVTHSLPANIVAGGIPAKIIKQINED